MFDLLSPRFCSDLMVLMFARVLSFFFLVCGFLVVAQPEAAATTVENPPAEEIPTLKFTWSTQGFTRLNVRKLYSDIFVVGDYKW